MDIAEIKFTPRVIKEIEDVAKTSIVKLMSDYSMTTVFLMVKKGFNYSEEQTDHAIDKYLEEQGDMFALYYEIVEVLLKKGLSPKAMEDEMPTLFLEANFKKEKKAPLVTNGKKEKVSQSKSV